MTSRATSRSPICHLYSVNTVFLLVYHLDMAERAHRSRGDLRTRGSVRTYDIEAQSFRFEA